MSGPELPFLLSGPFPENFTDEYESQPVGLIESGSWQSKELNATLAVSPQYPVAGAHNIVVESLYPSGPSQNQPLESSAVCIVSHASKQDYCNGGQDVTRNDQNFDRMDLRVGPKSSTEYESPSVLYHKPPHENVHFLSRERPRVHLLVILSCESGIVEQILRLLRPKTLAAVASACRAARRAVDSPTLWESCIARDYPSAASTLAAGASAAFTALASTSSSAAIPAIATPTHRHCTFHYERPPRSRHPAADSPGCGSGCGSSYKRQYRLIVQRQGIYQVGGCAGDLSAVAAVSRLGVGGAGARPPAAAPPLRTARIFAAAAEVGGQLFVCGGCTGLSACLRSVEVRVREGLEAA
jgi:hypothetical protein